MNKKKMSEEKINAFLNEHPIEDFVNEIEAAYYTAFYCPKNFSVYQSILKDILREVMPGKVLM